MRASKPSPSTIAAWQARRFGLFIHWGLYSMLGGIYKGKEIEGYSEQIMAHAKISKPDYEKLGREFNPLAWDPAAVARLAKGAGMKFVVLTAKHHDGFNLFHTNHSKFNVVDATPYGRDIVAEMAAACSTEGLEFGVYFSTIDWHFPGATGIDYEPDKGVRNDNVITTSHEELNVNQLKELLSDYGPICEVWFDMGHPSPEQSRRFADTVHDLRSEAMVSGRVWNHCGDFTVMGDNEVPEYGLEEPWQSPASIFDETWGYREWQERTDLESKIVEHLLRLVRVVSRGGNYLLNIGPRGDGSIVEFEADVLRGMGGWLKSHRDAIEGVEPQPFRHLDFGAATVKDNRLYLFITDWPQDGMLRLPGLQTQILGVKGRLSTITQTSEGQAIRVDEALRKAPINVLEVELAAPPVVLGSSVRPDPDGSFTLRPSDGDQFFRRNGAGYYDPPRLIKLRWRVEVGTAGEYSLTVPNMSQVLEPGLRFRVGDQTRLVLANDHEPVHFESGFTEIELFSESSEIHQLVITLKRLPSLGS